MTRDQKLSLKKIYELINKVEPQDLKTRIFLNQIKNEMQFKFHKALKMSEADKIKVGIREE